MKLDVVFVCQQGELEAQACLLAASLHRSCGEHAILHVIEPVPAEEYGAIAPATKRFLNGLGARWYQFRNPISDEYKVFNKLNAFNIRPEGERILFLDSDIIVRRPLHELQAYCNRPFAAKCGFSQAYSARAEDWRPIYQLFDLPVPAMRWPASDSQQWGPPYFSAAVILADPALDFSRHWIETCARIHQNAETLGLQKLGTVQLGLPVALARRNIPYALLDSRFNFALTKRRLRNFRARAWGDNEGYIYHYGNAARLLKDPFIPHEAAALVESYDLAEVFSLLPEWERLLLYLHDLHREAERRGRRKPPASLFKLQDIARNEKDAQDNGTSKPPAAGARRTVFVTGIPHSHAPQFAACFRQLPAVRDGIELKIDDGGFPRALFRVDEILKNDPEAMILIWVRDPFAAIAAWRALPSAHTNRLSALLEGVAREAPFLAEEQQKYLAALQEVQDPAMKQAGLWNFFAHLAHTHDERILILRDEDWRENPAAVWKHAVERMLPLPAPPLPEVCPDNPEPQAPAALTEWERECIKAACSYLAGALGYNLYDAKESMKAAV